MRTEEEQLAYLVLIEMTTVVATVVVEFAAADAGVVSLIEFLRYTG